MFRYVKNLFAAVMSAEHERQADMPISMKKCIFIVLGSLSLSLGAFGMFLPILPTTPFLLLSVYCYMRSSKRLHTWLIHHRIFGAYIYNYITYRAILKKTKIFSLVALWVSLIISMLLVNHWHVRALLILVGIGVSVHLMTLKTIEKSAFKPPGARINDKPPDTDAKG